MNFPDGLLDFTSNPDGVVATFNSGVTDFSAAERWSFLYREGTISVDSGVTDYGTPDGHSSTLWIARGSQMLSDRQRKQAVAYYGMNGSPAFYSVLNDNIYLYPTPTVTEDYRHGYYISLGRATDETFDEDTLDIPEQFQSLVELFVARKACILVNDRDRWSLVNDELNSEMKNVRDEVLRASSPGVPQTRTDTGF